MVQLARVLIFQLLFLHTGRSIRFIILSDHGTRGSGVSWVLASFFNYIPRLLFKKQPYKMTQVQHSFSMFITVPLDYHQLTPAPLALEFINEWPSCSLVGLLLGFYRIDPWAQETNHVLAFRLKRADYSPGENPDLEKLWRFLSARLNQRSPTTFKTPGTSAFDRCIWLR